MNEAARLLLLLGLVGTAVTVLGSMALWLMDEDRRIRRALRRVLKATPEAVVVARGRGRGVGVAFDIGALAVAWDAGKWCLIYRLDELTGAELLIDGEVAARVFRGEARRALDRTPGLAERVTLRLIFDDPRHPDFEMDLWLTGDERRRETRGPADAVQEANSWLARAEAVVRRPVAPRAAPAPVVRRDPDPEPEDEPEPEPDLFDEPEDDDPPWDPDN